MKFDDLLLLLGDEPLFDSATLLAGDVDPKDVRRQLSRWTRAGRIVQLRRGLYALAAPFGKHAAHPFVVSNALWPASYVSSQSALAHHHLIPEAVFAITSVTSGRPGRRETPLGVFDARHIRTDLLFGYGALDLGRGQRALVARPEKALLDLCHLQAGGDGPAFLRSLRLDNLDGLDPALLMEMAERSGKPKWKRVAALVCAMRADESWEEL